MKMSATVRKNHAINYSSKILTIPVNLCINIHTQLKWNFLTWANNALTRICRLFNKSPGTRDKKLSFEWLVRVVQETPKHSRLLLLIWLTPRGGRQVPVAEDIIQFRHRVS